MFKVSCIQLCSTDCDQNNLERTTTLIKKAIKQSKIKILKHYLYDTEPTKLTAQIEKITNYKIRKQNLEDEKRRVKNSDLIDKEKQLEKLNKRYTIGNVNFNSVIISIHDKNNKNHSESEI